ncbi:MAG: hypothetical protein M3285_08305, partial [Actinomycetota bacterium]|nr:hypothetical protein [Actinomycetota bacterium]
LADKGIVAALEADIRKHDLPVELHFDDDLRDVRFDESVETTIYFCCVAVLTRADSNVVVRLAVSLAGHELIASVEGVTLTADSRDAIEDRVQSLEGLVEEKAKGVLIRVPVMLFTGAGSALSP